MKYIGIDPGKKGGIALIDDDKNIYYLNIYTSDNLINMIKKYIYKDDVVCLVEKVWGFPGERGQFNFGANYGEILGIIKALDIKFTLITPQKWKKYYNLDSNKWKSINRAGELYPHANLIPKGKKVEHDGMAEALLIAEYGRCSDDWEVK